MVAVPNAERIILSAGEPMETGKTISVQVAGRKKRLRVQPESCRPNPEGGHLVVARVLDPDFPVRPQNGQRREARVRERIRAMSPQLPAYRAVTVDCSASGLQLETDAPLQPGETLPLELSLLDHGHDMPCTVRVQWCEQVDEKTFRSGCQFVETSKEFRLELRTLLARHSEYGRKRRFRGYSEQRRIKPLLKEVPPVETMTEVITEPPTPIPLSTEPIPDKEEQAPLDGVLLGFEATEASVRIKLLEDGEIKEVELDNVVTLSDHRGRSGHQIAFMTLRQMPGRARIRFLNAWREKVLEVETRRGFAWSA